MKRDYEHTPANFLQKAKQWYRLGKEDYNKEGRSFTTVQYVAFCFSLEFLLKALICLEKENATTKQMKKLSHKLGPTKEAALLVIKNEAFKKLLRDFFEKYPEFEDRDVIEVRYGKPGAITTYSLGIFEYNDYEDLLIAADAVIRSEWEWMKPTVLE